MTHSRFVPLVCLWSLVMLPAFGQQTARRAMSAPTQTRPNIIFILADDLAQADLGCYGNPFNETPNLNKLAQSGIRFTQAYSASPVCSPSRAAIMTGKHPARLKLTNFLVGERTDSASPVNPAPWVRYLPAQEQTLAERLKPLGYQTGFVGKWHLSPTEPRGVDSLAPWRQGFDYARLIGKNGLDYYRYGIFEGDFQKEVVDNGTTYLTDRLTNYALDFIRNRDPNQPFFLYLCYSAPHIVLVPRGDKVGRYLYRYERFKGQYNPYYAAVIESLDEGVGRVRHLLDQLGLAQNTLIVFTSDNGGVGLPELGPTPTSAGTFRKWKGFTYEGGIRVPTLISWPGRIAPNQTCDRYFVNTDYVPTFLDLLGQPATVSPDSRSILPLLRNPAAPFDRGTLYWHYPHFSNQMSRPSGALRQGNWKLVKSYETGQIELFDLSQDEAETRDLSQSNPQKAAQLHGELMRWLKGIDANMPVKK